MEIKPEVYDKNSIKDGYIIDQNSLGNVKYSKLGTGAGNGCGAISVYNVCVKLGLMYRFEDIYSLLSRKGTLCFGLLGTNPFSVVKFFKRIPAINKVKVYFNINKLKAHKAYIMLYFGFGRNSKKKIVAKGHYQFLDKTDDGNWLIYNPGTIKTVSLNEYINSNVFRFLLNHLIIGIND